MCLRLLLNRPYLKYQQPGLNANVVLADQLLRQGFQLSCRPGNETERMIPSL
jgi:hypothetical protein